MNRFWKRVLAGTLVAATAAGLLTGCGAQDVQENTQTDAAAGLAESAAEGKMYTIGISQFVEHPALDNCREGFIEGMKEAGFVEGENVTFNYQNSQGDMPTSQQVAANFVSKKSDLIVAIATPSAQAAYNAAEKSEIPVIYLAVSDPVAAGLSGEDGTSGSSICGVSDVISAEAQLKMIRQFMPDAQKIGILYSTSEVNSETQLKMYQDIAEQYGFEIVPSGVATSADIPLATEALLSKVDCLNNLTDNTIVAALATIVDKANQAKIPVFGSESEQVKNGCLASVGVDYITLGKQAGAMAAKVLNGEDISKMSFETMQEYSMDVNTTTLSNLGMTMPEGIEDSATLHK